jgi:hypothetical protein
MFLNKFYISLVVALSIIDRCVCLLDPKLHTCFGMILFGGGTLSFHLLMFDDPNRLINKIPVTNQLGR